jgi:hypothetical protein
MKHHQELAAAAAAAAAAALGRSVNFCRLFQIRHFLSNRFQ